MAAAAVVGSLGGARRRRSARRSQSRVRAPSRPSPRKGASLANPRASPASGTGGGGTGGGGTGGSAAATDAVGGGGGAHVSVEALWPMGRRLPASWPRAAGEDGVHKPRLVGTLRAHPEGVRHMALSPPGTDGLYSCGRDSDLRVWAPQRLLDESLCAPVARHPMVPGASACALCASADEPRVALGCTDGSVQLLHGARLGSPSAVVRRFELEADEGALLSLATLGGASGGSGGSPYDGLVLYTTEAGGVVGLDPRAGREAWRLETETPLGLMQASASDARGNWLVLGSSTGHCVLWDLRYAIRLSSWQTPSASRIRTMLPVRPPASLRPTVLVGSDDHLVCGWEIGESTPRCTLLLQPAGAPDAAAEAACAPALPPMSVPPPTASASGALAAPAAARPSVRALLAPADGSGVLSASSDARLRYWRLEPGYAGESFALGSGLGATFGVAEGRSTAGGCRVLREKPLAAQPAGGAGALPRRATVGAEDRACPAAVTSALATDQGLLFAGCFDGTIRCWSSSALGGK